MSQTALSSKLMSSPRGNIDCLCKEKKCQVHVLKVPKFSPVRLL